LENQFTDDLLEYYVKKDLNSFWQSWHSKHNGHSLVINHIEGVTSDQAIASKFADYFAACCGNVDMHRSTLCERSCEQYDCSDGLLSVEDVDTILRSNLKLGKAPGIDHLTAEHILYAHPAVSLALD